ncbi:hypothetical protein AALD22_07515 [Lachnospiraceae bacterium 56-18]
MICDPQCGRQMTVAAEEYLRAWMAKPALSDEVQCTVMTGCRIRGGLFCIM